MDFKLEQNKNKIKLIINESENGGATFEESLKI